MIHAWNQTLWDKVFSSPGGPPGTLLLAGPKGTGKRSFAQTLAQAILCSERGATNTPCGACKSCRLFLAGSHPDFRLVEPAQEELDVADAGASAGQPPARGSRAILVAQIRALSDFLGVSAHLAGARVVLIQPAERLHPSAASALLKTLEEPARRTHFNLVSDRPAQLLPTVTSRCFRLGFGVPRHSDSVQWLAERQVDRPDIALAQAGFSPLAAEQLAQGDFWNRRRALTDLLGSRGTSAGELASHVAADELPLLCELLYRWCYDLLALRLTGQVRYSPDYAKTLARLADNADVLHLQSLVAGLNSANRALEHPLSARLVIERLAIQYTRAISAEEL
jgi:DNA polymerase III subunit delta'